MKPGLANFDTMDGAAAIVGPYDWIFDAPITQQDFTRSCGVRHPQMPDLSYTPVASEDAPSSVMSKSRCSTILW